MVDFSQVTKFLDAYTLRARLFPAIIGAAPAFAAIALLISWDKIALSNLVSTGGLLVIVYALADAARSRGARLEPKIYQEMGGKPSITMFRRTGDETIAETTKDRYRSFVAGKIGRSAPSVDVEKADQAAADAFYEECGIWLRTNTRDAKVFPILFNELVSYGFRRNLLGVKWPAMALNVSVAIIVFGALWLRNNFDANDDATMRFYMVLAVAIVHAIYLLLVVSKTSVKEAAKKYARELILSCETLMLPKAPTNKPRKPKK